MPGYPCCCDTGVSCPVHCSGGVPNTLTVSISGALNDACSVWPSIDGSYTVDFTTCTRWQADFTTPVVEMEIDFICKGAADYDVGTHQLRISAVAFKFGTTSTVSGFVRVLADIGGVNYGETHSFEKSLVLPADCCGWTAFNLPYKTRTRSVGTTDYGGDLSTATMTITSVADGGC